MLKVYTNKKEKTTTVVTRDNDMDAINKVVGRLNIRGLINDSMPDYIVSSVIRAFELKHLIMPTDSKATVKCREQDVFSEEVGVREATLKMKNNYQKSMEKAFVRWQVAMLRKIYTTNPSTFDAALSKFSSQMKTKKK